MSVQKHAIIQSFCEISSTRSAPLSHNCKTFKTKKDTFSHCQHETLLHRLHLTKSLILAKQLHSFFVFSETLSEPHFQYQFSKASGVKG